MVSSRTCKQVKDDGSRCQAPPLQESDLCFWHDPATQKDAQQARSLGGANRRKEQTLATVYEVEGLETVQQIRRLLELALMGELALENSHNRSRILIAIVNAAAKLLEVGELTSRLEAIEAALGPRLHGPEPNRRKRWGFR